MSQKTMKLSVLFISIAIGIYGCSSSEEADTPSNEDTASQAQKRSPEQIAEAFFQAGNAGDRAGIEKLFTEKAREAVSGDDSEMDMTDSAYEEYTVGEATIDGDTAEVAVEIVELGETQKMTLKMRDENDAWRIYAMGIDLGDGMEMTINLEALDEMLGSLVEGIGDSMSGDFEAAMESAMMGGTEEEIAAKKESYDAIRAITPEDYEADWRNDKDFSGTAAGAVLSELSDALDLSIHEADLKDVLGKKVSVDVKGMSRLQAIDTISRELGYYPQFPNQTTGMGMFGGAMIDAFGEGLESIFTGEDSFIQISGDSNEDAKPEEEPAANAIRFIEDTRPYPVVFSGPFVFEIDNIQENAPLPTGSIALSVKTYGLDTGQLVLLAEMSDSLELDGLVDAKGRSLIEENMMYMSNGEVAGASYADFYSYELHNLIREVTEIDRFAGIQSLVMPTEVQEISFEGIEAGQTKTIGDISIEVKDVGDYTRFDILGPDDVIENMKVQFWPSDANGNSLGITYSSADSWQSGEIQADLNTSAEPHTVSLKLVTKSETLEYPFEFRNIPFKNFALTPERMEELSFEGHDAPLTMSLKQITERDPNFSKIELEVTNHSNKEVQSAMANFEYLNASGTKIDDFPHTVSGGFTADGWGSLAGIGQTATQESTAFNMPPDTQSIHMVVRMVEFTDGTSWSVE